MGNVKMAVKRAGLKLWSGLLWLSVVNIRVVIISGVPESREFRHQHLRDPTVRSKFVVAILVN
jgi:hypothetical protein